jgi:hypothetical protein
MALPRLFLWLAALAAVGCIAKADTPRDRAGQDKAGDQAPSSDSSALAEPAPSAEPASTEGNSERELLYPRPTEPFRVPSGRRRSIELILRSTPAGAVAAVDGVVVGPTPTFWRGDMTGKACEFTFVLTDYAMARYRFVPTSDGIVHATLRPLVRGSDEEPR